MSSNLFLVSGLIESLFRRDNARAVARLQRARRVAPRAQLRLENLEDRMVPSGTPMAGPSTITEPVKSAQIHIVDVARPVLNTVQITAPGGAAVSLVSNGAAVHSVTSVSDLVFAPTTHKVVSKDQY